MMEHKTTIYETSKQLPAESGRYLTFTSGEGGHWAVFDYSAKHKKFNAFDCLENAKYAIDVSHWTELPVIDGDQGEGEISMSWFTCPNCGKDWASKRAG